MGNPKPTRSKPFKIGRKHTGAPSIRKQNNVRKGREIERLRTVESIRKYRAKVAAFWRGELDTPPKPTQ